MKVYWGKDNIGDLKASMDYSKIKNLDMVRETDLDVVHNKVYAIRVYYGFDYNYDTGSMYSCIAYSPDVYHSVHAARKSKMWKEKEKIAKENPQDHHVTDFSIASDDCGEPFCYGDAMAGKFNMTIVGIKVI